jgi:hypothetical protein
MSGGNGVVIDRNGLARRVLRKLRARQRALRISPRGFLLLALVVLGYSSIAVADGGAAGAVIAKSSAILPIRSCGDLTSEHLVSPTRVPVRFFSARLSDFAGAEYCHVTGEIGPDFYFDLRLPRSTYEGQYVQEGCGGSAVCCLLRSRWWLTTVQP